MPQTADELRHRLIRNFDDAPKVRELRAPLYDSLGARLAPGPAAGKLGISIDLCGAIATAIPPRLSSSATHRLYRRTCAGD